MIEPKASNNYNLNKILQNFVCSFMIYFEDLYWLFKKFVQVRLVYLRNQKIQKYRKQKLKVLFTLPCHLCTCMYIYTYIVYFYCCFCFNPNEILCFCDFHFSFNSEQLESFPCSYSEFYNIPSAVVWTGIPCVSTDEHLSCF